MIQVVSGDSWSSVIARGIFSGSCPDPSDADGTCDLDGPVAVFFVSYFFVGSVILLNVVIGISARMVPSL